MIKKIRKKLKMTDLQNKEQKCKYSRLSDDVIKKKLNVLLSDESLGLSERINFILTNFDREQSENLLSEAEKKVIEIKEMKRKEDEENKRLEQLAAEKENERIRKEKEEKIQRYRPLVEPSEFAGVKTSFSFIKENENGEPIFENIDDQVKFCLTEHPFKLYKAVYRERNIYDENKSFLHTNLNSGFSGVFSELKDYMYACFRLIINPLDGSCLYNSWWIINSELSIEEVLGSDSILFDFKEVPSNKIEDFIMEFKRSDLVDILDETYSR